MRWFHIAALVLLVTPPYGCKRKAVVPPAIEPVQVEKYLDLWVQSQNAGKFSDYSTHYATKFEGVKRSGPRTYSFDREGWLADRERMFKKPMQVEVASLRVQTSSTMAVASFVQTWASGSYRDVGAKRIVLVRENQTLRISREEMLSSEILTVDPPSIGETDTEQRFLVEDETGAVVLTTELEEDWRKGKLRSITSGVASDVDEQELPQFLSMWKGKKLHFYSDNDAPCENTIADFELIARAELHFGTYQQWSGEFSDEAPYTQTQQLEEHWSIAAGEGGILLGHLENDDCTGLIAQSPTLPPPVFFEDAEVSEREAFAKLHALADFVKTQADFETTEEGEGAEPGQTWVEDQWAHGWEHKGVTYVFVGASNEGMCGEWGGWVSASYKVKDGKWELLEENAAIPAAMLDLDQDDEPEYYMTGDDWSQDVYLEGVGRYSIPNYDCPC